MTTAAQRCYVEHMTSPCDGCDVVPFCPVAIDLLRDAESPWSEGGRDERMAA